MGPMVGENGLDVETLLKQKFRAGPAPSHASVFSPVDNKNDKNNGKSIPGGGQSQCKGVEVA